MQESKKGLYEKQKDTLDKFLERGAITKEQYDKSLNTLKEKMGIKGYSNILIVSFCERLGDTIRIITAWKANKKQREEYNANH